MRKFFLALMIGLMIIPTSTQAYGVFWYDMNAGLEQWKKVVIFPLANAWARDKFLIDRSETSLLYWENKHLMERFEKKIRNLHTIRLSPDIREKGEILIDKYGVLLQKYPSERARAEAVFEQTGADMYILPTFKQNKVQVDISPRVEVDLELKSWTEEKNGPDGDKKYDEKKWTEHHVIPETKVYLHIMELEFDGYDTEANKVLTFTDARREYGVDEKHQFRNITKYIRKDFGDIKSRKRADKGKAGELTIGFQNLKAPKNLGLDEFALRGIYFATQVEALDNLDGVRVLIDGNAPTTPNYYVTGMINRWEMKSTWHAPYATVSSSLEKTEKSKWTDKNGKEHEKKTYYYKDKITDHLGGWSFWFYAGAQLQLIDARTGAAVLSKNYLNGNDKIMDAYRADLDSFYKDVKAYLKTH